MAQAIRDLPGGDGSTAILERADGHFIQVAGGQEDRGFYLLEYREGDASRHFRCVERQLDADTVVAAFRSYLNGDDDFKRRLEWQPFAAAQRAERWRLLVPVAVLLAVSALWWLMRR